MSQASLEGQIASGDRLLLDSTTLIAYLNGGERVSPVAEHTVDFLVRTGRNPGFVSMLSVMEVLVRPRQRDLRHYEHALDFLTRFPNLRTCAIDLAVAQEAAGLRAGFGLDAPDALVVATGLVHQVGHLVTNDRTWAKRLGPLQGRVGVCLLSQHLPWNAGRSAPPPGRRPA